jgi:hypothetical protein
MNDFINLQDLLSQATGQRQQATSFALFCLGAVESLMSGAISSTDSVRLVFHIDNCQFVRETLKDEIADEVMSRGVQLPDLFEALPAEIAQQEYQRELVAMHSLCLKLIGGQQKAAA